jgi:adenylate kinase family enzyme
MVGTSGSGKTTVGRALAARLDIQFVELDAIFHQPGWTELPREEFRARVRDVVATDGWILDGNYSSVLDLVWARADTVVWFDLPRATVMRQLVPRTFGRMLSRRELWNGNRESLRYLLNPAESILWWAWTQHDKYAKRYAAALRDPANAHLAFIRVRSRADARALLAGRHEPDRQ